MTNITQERSSKQVSLQPINILLIGFNRSELLKDSLKRLRSIHNCCVWVAIDGFRPYNLHDQKEHSRILEILPQYGVSPKKTLISSYNRGCRNGVIAALSWFFRHNEYGIILEDDIQLDSGFLNCMQKLLVAYKDDDSIFSISSHSEIPKPSSSSYSAEFMRMPFCRVWGWASWRRAWHKHLAFLRQTENYGLIRLYFLIPKPYRSFDAALRLYHCKNTLFDTWDYEWNFTHLMTNSFSITPYGNYCLNVGFGESATHTINPNAQPWSSFSYFNASSLIDASLPLSSPTSSEINLIGSQCGFPRPDNRVKDTIKLLKHVLNSYLRVS